MISGRLYCQQNGLNKACAQVALRSLLSEHLPEGDISYRRINELSASMAKANWAPAKGLSSVQIRSVLNQLHIGYRDIDYVESEKDDPEIRQTHPFQKFLYAGVESGAGALLGFSLAGPGLQEPGKHIIPLFGHTFNKDTWVPEAEQSTAELLRLTLRGGSVYHLQHPNLTSAKPHYFVVLNLDPHADAYLVLAVISSKIQNVRRRCRNLPDSTLVEISPSDYIDAYFTQPSIVDCNTLFRVTKLDEDFSVSGIDTP